MPTTSESLSIAVQHHQAGRLQSAEQIYREILQTEPNHVDALHLLGVIAHQVGQQDVAVQYIEKAINLRPNEPSFHNNLGNAYSEQGKRLQAVTSYRRAIQLKPDYADALNNLGTVLQEQGKLDEATASYRRALEVQPDFAEGHTNLGAVLKVRGKLDDAVASYRKALSLRPNYPVAHNNLGNALKEQGKLDEAFACYKKALELKPDFSEAHCNLGNILKGQGLLEEAVECYRRSLMLASDNAETLNHLGNALKDQGKLDEALGCYRRAMDLKPSLTDAHSNLLSTYQYRSGITLSELKAAHLEFDRKHAAAFKSQWRFHQNRRDPNRKLRIGFLSPDFGRHPVGYFLIRTLENLDRGQFEVACYNNRTHKDDMTARFQLASQIWRDVGGQSDDEIAAKITEDRIDILVDLAGHTASNRALVFARKPAPIQIAWIGYEGTTGLQAIDYLLADQHTVPEGSESHYCERVLRMPGGYICYDPPGLFPEVAVLPATVQGYVSFGSFNNPAKITREVIETWSKILQRVPQSRLKLKYRGMNDKSVSDRFSQMFEEFGVEPSRIEYLPHSPHRDYLSTYAQIDIGLDPFPFGGGITTCESLWMGVPVVTCPGETFASRHGMSHLVSAGVEGTIARDLDDYVEIAVSLANDLSRLAGTRAGLRERVASSNLCNGKRFAAELGAVLRQVWKEWLETETKPQQHPAATGNSLLDSFAVPLAGVQLSPVDLPARKVLNVGGYSKEISLPSAYNGWDHVLLDIDPKCNPDVLCDARELTSRPAEEFDAIYCSHNLEHYYRHDAPKVLAGFLHVLKEDGFVQIRVPDLAEVMKTVIERGLDVSDVLYQVGDRPITVLDVLYGYGVEIEQSGSDFFAHKTGFTEKSLIEALKQARFAITFTGRGNLEIVAYAFKNWPTDYAISLLNLPKVDRPVR